LDDSGWLRRFRPVIGWGIALAIVGGTFLALAAHLIAISKTDFGTQVLFHAAGWSVFLVSTGIFVIIYDVDPGGWRGYIVRIGISVADALVIGIWTRVSYWMLFPLVKLLFRDSQPTPAAEWLSDMTLLGSLFLPIGFMLFLAVVYRKKRVRTVSVITIEGNPN